MHYELPCQHCKLRCIRLICQRKCSCHVDRLLSDELVHALQAVTASSVDRDALTWSTNANAHAELASSCVVNSPMHRELLLPTLYAAAHPPSLLTRMPMLCW